MNKIKHYNVLKQKSQLLIVLTIVALSVLLMTACGSNEDDSPALSSTIVTPPVTSPEEAPLIRGLEEASEIVCQVKSQSKGSHQYTALDFDLADNEDDYVLAAVLFRDAGKLSEGNICVITQNTKAVITYGEPDDIYRYTDKCSLEIRNGDTVSYYVEDYETGEVVHFAFRCSELEDGTPHFETVDAPQ